MPEPDGLNRLEAGVGGDAGPGEVQGGGADRKESLQVVDDAVVPGLHGAAADRPEVR